MLAGAASIAVACSDDPALPGTDAGPDGSEPVDASTGDADAEPPVVAKGKRVLGIATDVASIDFADDVPLVLDAGARTTNLGFAWDEIERPFDGGADAGDDDAGDGGPQTVLFQPGLHFADLVLDGFSSQAILTLDALDASGSRAPSDLAGRPIDDAEVGIRFDRLTDYALDQTRNTKLTAVLLATAVDVLLGDDAAKHGAFTTFFTRAAAHARAVRPGVVVGFGVTAEGLVARKDRLGAALGAADVVAVSYLPVDRASSVARSPREVGADLDGIVAAAPSGKPIFVYAAGYPSAPASGADEATQAGFVTAMFRAWDRHAERVPVVSFRELDDATAAAAAEVARREGRNGPGTEALLRSLGLRDAAGRRKASFSAVVREARARGF